MGSFLNIRRNFDGLINTKTTLVIVALAAVMAVMVTASPKLAFAPGPCVGCAKAFAPGQLAESSGLPANYFAPPQQHQLPPPYNIFAPGELKETPTGPGP